MRKGHVLTVAGVMVAGVVFGLLGPARADKGPKPPKQAIDGLRSKLQKPDPIDPDSIGGVLKPGTSGLSLVLRDPETGDVLREADGKPKLARNPDGSLATFLPEQIPPDQLAAQAKHQEVVNRAQRGDQAAQAHLDNEARRTADATRPK